MSTTIVNPQNRFDALYGEMKRFINESAAGKVSVGSVAMLTRYAMQLIQTSKTWKLVPGSEKRQIVMDVVRAVLTDLLNDQEVANKLDEDSKQAILLALETVPFLIDASVDFAKTYHQEKTNDGSVQPNTSCFCCF